MCPRADRDGRGEGGFTLLEMVVGLTLFTVVGVSLFTVLIRTGQGDRMGTSVTEAQQNARGAMNLIVRDLRELGYGLGPDDPAPIVAASEYRLTLGIDRNRDGDLDPGERITYFMDPVGSDPLVYDTPNPHDRLLRRVISTAQDSLADPGPGKGDVVALGVTQHAKRDTTRDGGGSYRNVRLFDFMNGTGASLLGAANDPEGAEYGKTVPDSLLGSVGGRWVGPGPAVTAIRVDIVTEGHFRSPATGEYPAVRVTGSINPRNLHRGRGLTFLTGLDPDSTGGGGTPPHDEGGDPDTTGTEETPQQLPPAEPPIRVPSKSVVSLCVVDLNERDSEEGSRVTADGQHDVDIAIGTDAITINNLLVWFEGYPDRYASDRLYNSYPSYYGNTSRQILAVTSGNLDGDVQYPDIVSAVGVTDTQGGFEVWLNQGSVRGGYVGIGSSTTMPNGYYSQSSGKGLSVALADFGGDGDVDLVLGTRTGTATGKLELWGNGGGGTYTFRSALTAAGEVTSVATADFNHDGRPDIAAGTRTHDNDKSGKIEIWLNNGGWNFTRRGPWASSGKVTDLAAGSMDTDGSMDLVAGTRTGHKSGKVELWLNDGAGTLRLADVAAAEDIVLSVAVGQIDHGNASPDVVAGTNRGSVQAWFSDPAAAREDEILPAANSWKDASTGGAVKDIAIAKLETSQDTPHLDLLNDVIAGTSVSSSQGEVVIYLNPYVWTLNP